MVRGSLERSPVRAAADDQKGIKFKPKSKDTDWITEQRQGYIFAHFKKVRFSPFYLIFKTSWWKEYVFGWMSHPTYVISLSRAHLI